MSSTPSRNSFLHYAIILFASVAITAPIYLLGIPNGNDLPQHYRFAQTVETSIAEGTPFPSWSADSNHGFGDIGIRFYPPLSYYVLVIAKFVGGSWYNASVLAFAFWFFLGGIGVYLLSREWLSERSSLAAALIFLFIPYHANQIFNAFFYAEFSATAILPFCFLFVTRVCRRGSIADVAGLAIAYSALVLTNLPLTVIGSISLLVFSLTSLKRESLISSVLKLGAAVTAALAASSFYWIRMVTELSFGKIAYAELTERAYDFRINFLLSYFTIPTSDYLERSLIFSDLMLAASLVMAAAGCIPFLVYGNDRRRMIPIFVLLACALFFATPVSLPIWEHADFLARVQFPWRWLAVISIAAPVIAAAGFDTVASFFRSEKRPITIIIAGVTAAVFTFTAAQIIRPAVFIPRAQFEQRVEDLRTARNCECFWPLTASPDALPVRDLILPGDRKAELIDHHVGERTYLISAGDEGLSRIPVFYYPHWKAYIDGSATAAMPDQFGAITVQLPPRAVEVAIRFEEPSIFWSAVILSFVSWLGLLGVTGALFVISRRRNVDRYRP